MGIIGHVVKPKGLRFMNEIKTYGELCEQFRRRERILFLAKMSIGWYTDTHF